MEKPRKQGSSPHFVRQRLFSALAGKNRNFSYRERRRVRYKSIKKQGNYDVPCKSSFTRDLRAPPSQSGSNRHRYSIPPGFPLRGIHFLFYGKRRHLSRKSGDGQDHLHERCVEVFLTGA